MKRDNTTDTTNATQKPTCGIIMPISACTSNGIDYSAEHWQSVRTFLEDAIKEAGCEPKAVWEGEDQSIIHGRIVNNIAEFPLMICVVCGCNNNVMIELGLRLMTDKPVLVIADDNYKIPFDVNVLEMIVMPTMPDYKDYQEYKARIKEVLPKMLKPDYKTFSSYFKQVSPRGISGIEKVEVAQFMNDTKEAVQRLQSQVAILISQKESSDWERRSFTLRRDRMLQRENAERESVRRLYEARLAELRRQLETKDDENAISRKPLRLLMDEFLSIQTEVRLKGLDEYPSIMREIMRTGDMIDSVRRHSRGNQQE